MKSTLTLALTAGLCALIWLSITVVRSHTQNGQSTGSPSWRSAGQNINNTRDQPDETIIKPSNVGQLKVKWRFSTGGDVSATPTVVSNRLYATDFGGSLYAIAADTGKQIWRHSIAEYNGQSGAISRVSPLVLHDKVVIGDNYVDISKGHDGAKIIAVSPVTGKLLWITKVESHPAAIITGAPVASNGVVYVGVSSTEESMATVAGYPCCTFRGSVVALDETTGKILWKTYVVPDNGGKVGGFAGNAIWQSPSIDPSRGLLYIGTGDNDSVPETNKQCQAANLKSGGHASCTPPDDHVDSALALDLKTGAIKWAMRALDYDTWNVSCVVPFTPGATPCPTPAGPDLDFTGSASNLIGNIVGFAQKSGIYWALNPDTGAVLWNTQVGPGSVLGGILWGTATDGKAIYAPISNFNKISYTLRPSGRSINWGSWSALDVATGKILWQTADPTAGTPDLGAASVANGVVFAGSMSGQMYAFDAKSGDILWSFDSGGSVLDGPSIVNGTVYWGSGYANLRALIHGKGNNKIYAFSLN